MQEFGEKIRKKLSFQKYDFKTLERWEAQNFLYQTNQGFQIFLILIFIISAN